MTDKLQYDFLVNKENNTITVIREFAAPVNSVWAAWTTPELLDRWWAPKPWKAETKLMDFREGGQWLYAMVGPDGEKHWGITEYISIKKPEGWTAEDSFCDSEGNINNGLPRQSYTISFSESANITKVEMVTTYRQLSDLEQIINMGFKEGLTAAMENLVSLLEEMK